MNSEAIIATEMSDLQRKEDMRMVKFQVVYRPPLKKLITGPIPDAGQNIYYNRYRSLLQFSPSKRAVMRIATMSSEVK